MTARGACSRRSPPQCSGVGSPPCSLETGAGLFEAGRRGADLPLALPVSERIEADSPVPLVDVMRHPGALADRPNRDIAVIDVPRLLVTVRFSVAGEDGHGS